MRKLTQVLIIDSSYLQSVKNDFYAASGGETLTTEQALNNILGDMSDVSKEVKSVQALSEDSFLITYTILSKH